MKQYQFEARYAEEWERFERSLHSSLTLTKEEADEKLKMTRDYRRICQHLALARSRGYSMTLQDRLNQLLRRAQHHLYPEPASVSQRLIRYFTTTFPRAVRRSWRWIALSAAIFLVALLLTASQVHQNPNLIYQILPHETVREFEQMYSWSHYSATGPSRRAEDDWVMFGFYLSHNSAVGFRLYGGGVLAGIGTLVSLAWNGIYFGAVTAYLLHLGKGYNLFGFVVPHTPFELAAILLSASAGFQLGSALLFPGRRPRLQKLRSVARETLELLYGVATLFFLAAVVEAFWSARFELPLSLKLLSGGVLALLLLSYLFLAGGDRDSH